MAWAFPADVFDYTHQYLQILIFATGFQLAGFGLNAVIRAEGNAHMAMWTLLIGVFLNFVLAWLFLFEFHWGMRGAASATAIAQGVSATWVLAYFFRGKSVLRLHLRHILNLRFHGPTCRRILLIGSPMFAMQLFGALMFGIVNYQAGKYGQAEYGDARDCDLGQHLRALHAGQYARLWNQPGHSAHRRLQLRRQAI